MQKEKILKYKLTKSYS